jgi:hypothetical protein
MGEIIGMDVEYIQYPKNELKKGQDVLQDRISSVFDFYNAQTDPRLHLDNVNWSYLNRNSGYGLDGLCFVVDKKNPPENDDNSVFKKNEFEFFTKNDVDIVFFQTVRHETKKPAALDQLAYHELWHLIERKNDILHKDLVFEGAAELASLMCSHTNWKEYIDRTMEMYMQNELFNAKTGMDENVLQAHNFFYIIPTKLLSRYCSSLSDILDPYKRTGAIMEYDKVFAEFVKANADNPDVVFQLLSFLPKSQRKEMDLDW